ncbi:MAG: hypothetical protein Q7S46_10520, partial [Gallionella sp.]|nr:hypothetical protein [Gallionella sp.]
MATRYLIGRGELLTYRIEAPKKAPNDKVHPYTLAEAKEIIIPEIELASAEFDRLPASACADDIAVASVVLHPAYIAKSYFPKHLLDQAGLASVGSRTSTLTRKFGNIMSSQLSIRILSSEVPLDGSIFLVAGLLPGIDFRLQ